MDPFWLILYEDNYYKNRVNNTKVKNKKKGIKYPKQSFNNSINSRDQTKAIIHRKPA